jgi:hypothetical protein
MLERIKQNTDRQAREPSADIGCCSEHNLKTLKRHRIRGYVATGRVRHRCGGSGNPQSITLRTGYAPHTPARGLEKPLPATQTGGGTSVRADQETQGFRQFLLQFLLRGLRKARGEWSLICTAHNLLKLKTAMG